MGLKKGTRTAIWIAEGGALLGLGSVAALKEVVPMLR